MRMAAYCRVSTEKEEQLSSLENQREFFEQYADKEGDTLVKIYADEGISGKSMNKREAFTQLLEDSQTGAFDYVAVKDIADLPVTHLISYTVSAPCVPTVLMSDFCRIIRRL